VVVGPGGVFLIETKMLNGQVDYVDGVLRVTYPESPSHDYEFTRLEGRLRGCAAELRGHLADAAPSVRQLWVTAVVVIWGDFALRRCEGDRVVYLHGAELASWLVEQPPKLSDRDRRLIQLAFSAQVVGKSAPAFP
jgi:hypothetical protein